MVLCITVLCPALSSDAGDGRRVPIVFADAHGKELCRFDAEAAVTVVQRAQGLKYRPSMQPRTGMFFVNDRDEVQHFWMKDTYIPLDLIFMNGSYEVVHVHRGAVPGDETYISSRYPARYVLEVNAGEAKGCRIVRGTKAHLSSPAR